MVMKDAIAAVLGICFRSLANSKNTDSVVSTAAATVRQVTESPNASLCLGPQLAMFLAVL